MLGLKKGAEKRKKEKEKRKEGEKNKQTKDRATPFYQSIRQRDIEI